MQLQFRANHFLLPYQEDADAIVSRREDCPFDFGLRRSIGAHGI
jgi:hypothetical protein